MPTVDNFLYKEIASSLDKLYPKKNHKYFYSQNYVASKFQPLASVVPLYEEFWGPKVLTILILSQRYDFTTGIMSIHKDKIRTGYKNWVKYKVLIWVDMTLANKVSEAGDPEYPVDMFGVIDAVDALCEEMEPYGFVYMGELNEGVDANFFKQHIDAFYKEQ
jgi:hypothetical protein